MQILKYDKEDKAYKHHCGGALLTNYLILTAAHCVEGIVEKELQLVAGQHKLDEFDKEEQTLYIRNIIKHDKRDTAGKSGRNLTRPKSVFPFVVLLHNFVRLYFYVIYIIAF